MLTTFTKLADVEGIHAAARLAWNAGLLLLQPGLRKHVKRAFNAAARALAVAASPLTRLRAALHLEAGKCDAAEEALIKVGWRGKELGGGGGGTCEANEMRSRPHGHRYIDVKLWRLWQPPAPCVTG